MATNTSAEPHRREAVALWEAQDKILADAQSTYRWYATFIVAELAGLFAYCPEAERSSLMFIVSMVCLGLAAILFLHISQGALRVRTATLLTIARLRARRPLEGREEQEAEEFRKLADLSADILKNDLRDTLLGESFWFGAALFGVGTITGGYIVVFRAAASG